MEFRQRRLSIEEAKEIDMVSYLSGLGYEPARIRGNDFWYLSPLREEKTPSFKVNRRLNKWYDHGTGKGGNLVDFGVAFYQCTVAELLAKLAGDFSLQQPLVTPPKITHEPEHKISIKGDFVLASFHLLRYLKERRIPMEIADKYCREVRYGLNGKTYYGIGFKNDSGGYEIRNPYLKTSSSPKGITTFQNGSDEVVVFEGFMDFLSFKMLHKYLPENSQDFVVLNSLSFFERARPFMEGHHRIRLYLDRDAAGRDCTGRALSMNPKYTDDSHLYKNYKDLNDWVVNFGKLPKSTDG